MTKITGNTYPVKEQLKALGAKWNGREKCWEVPDDKAEAARKLVGPTPLYSSPPPRDLGTADPVALAAKHARTAVAGEKVVSFDAEGREPEPDGSIRRIRGKRYVQVAHDRPRYFSRSLLDDFDMFDRTPGHWYQWDGVEVEPTDEERAKDAEAQARKDAEAKARQEAVDKAKADEEARRAEYSAATMGLERCSASPVGAPVFTGRSVQVAKTTLAEEFTSADGRNGWRVAGSFGDDYRTVWMLPADAARAARLAWAAKCGVTPESAAEWLDKYRGCEGTDAYEAVASASDAEKDSLRTAAIAAREAKIAVHMADERRTLPTWARSQLFKLGLIEPTESDRYSVPGSFPHRAIAWELVIPDDSLRAYAESRVADRHGSVQIEGAELVVRLPRAAWTAKGKKPAPVETLPRSIQLHNFCTARIKWEPE